MQDFIIMTRKASGQFRDILRWPDAPEYSLRRILIGCLKTAAVMSISGVEASREFTYYVDLETKWVRESITIKVTRNSDKLSPDGTMPCAFVTDIEILTPEITRVK